MDIETELNKKIMVLQRALVSLEMLARKSCFKHLVNNIKKEDEFSLVTEPDTSLEF